MLANLCKQPNMLPTSKNIFMYHQYIVEAQFAFPLYFKGIKFRGD